MKKIILLLLLVIPVVVTMLSFMIAGFVSREISYIPISHITINHDVAGDVGLFYVPSGDDLILHTFTFQQGDEIDLTQIIITHPARARFSSLLFNIFFDDVAVVDPIEDFIEINEYGVLRALQSTNDFIVIEAMRDTNVLLTIRVEWILA